MQLRNVSTADVEAYVRMRCDPVMMADLGGPLPRAGMADKVHRDAREAAEDIAWLKMIVPDATCPDAVAGMVALWAHDSDDGPVSEIGWMVLPEFQGQGLGKLAVRTLLEQAGRANRWGLVHAFPAVNNAASNGICRSVGFQLLAETAVFFSGRPLKSNHWVIDPAQVLS
ncbi:GNAT family N-acetyltransferase [Streptomyces sp. NPDC058045]|uniref:GNAT family N-acetyltransferase n=1 Tax=Streptomyces sp. NPDC058045 TaxID=3346311 RepID=UPI0036EB41A2